MTYRESAECLIPADLENVASAVDRLRVYLSDRGFPAEELNNLLLAVAEGVNNAIIHGARNQPDATLRLRWAWNANLLEIQVRDPGRFEPSADWHKLPADPLSEHGRGGFIITSFFDDVRHANSDQGHDLILVKHTSVDCQQPQVAAAESELMLMTQDLSDSYESLAALFNISALLATSVTLDDFLHGVLQRLRSLLAADSVCVRIRDQNGDWTTQHERASPAIPQPESRPGPLEQTVWEEQLLHAVTNGEGLTTDDPVSQWQAGLVVCPISFNADPIGLLTVGRRTGDPFTAGQTNLVRTVADFIGVACINNRLRRHREEQLREIRELEIAAQIQRALLPAEMPSSPHWQMHGVCRSARQVGGDFFDAFETATGDLAVIIADVMGKGVPAAMFGALLRAAVHARLDVAHDPGLLLTKINQQLAPDLSRADMFITVLAVKLPSDGGKAVLASAGHTAPWCFDPSRRRTSARYLEINAGMPLGVMPDTRYKNEELSLADEAVVVLGTDGLYEFDVKDDVQFGMAALETNLPEWWTGDVRSFCEAVLTHLNLLDRGHQADDRTMVSIQRKTENP
ncbi:MAG: SpoIIE family protein phosphatase [Opitutaceae bacterium]